MSYHPLVNFFIEGGVPPETVSLLLMFPLIATMVAFFRQIIGIKAFGIYTPSIITFAFLAFGEKGLKYGVAIFFAVIAVGMLSRYLLQWFRLLYLPRVAITLTIVSLAVLVVLALGGSFQRTGLATIDIFPLLIMITLAEKFVGAQIEQGSKTALILAGETLIISIIGYFIVRQETLANFILIHPWVILFTLAVNVALGKWTGLRLIELIRFRRILSHKN